MNKTNIETNTASGNAPKEIECYSGQPLHQSFPETESIICNDCGLPHDSETSDCYHNEGNAPRSKVLNIIPSKVEALMHGVWRIMRAHDLVTLEYTDGQRESAMIPVKRWSEIHNNTFSIVGEVQRQRKS